MSWMFTLMMNYLERKMMQIINQPITNAIKEAVGQGFFYCGFVKKSTGTFREGIFKFDVKQYKSIVDGEIKTIGDRPSPITVNDQGMCLKEFYNKKYLAHQKHPHDFTSVRYDSIRLLKFKKKMYTVKFIDDVGYRLLMLEKIPSKLEDTVKLLYRVDDFDFTIGNLPKTRSVQ